MEKHYKSGSFKKRAKLRQPRREPMEKELFTSSECRDKAQHVSIGAIGTASTRASEEEHYSAAADITTTTTDVQLSARSEQLQVNRIQLKRYAKNDYSHDQSQSEVDPTDLISDSSDSDNDLGNDNCAISSSDSNDSDYEVEVSSDSNVDGDGEMDREISEQCQLQLIEQGLDEHLKSPICNKSTAMTQTMMMRYTRFLVWLWKFIGLSTTVQEGFNVCHLISSFIIQYSQLLPRYYTHLKEAYLFKASTIIDHNENFQVLVHWYAVYRVRKELFVVDPSQLYTINLIIKSMRKAFSRERKVEEAKNTDNTIEGLVKSRKWPIGGLQELSDAVVSQMEWARRLSVKGCIISLSIYNLFMQVFMSSLFTSKSLLIIFVSYCFLLYVFVRCDSRACWGFRPFVLPPTRRVIGKQICHELAV